MVTKKQIRERKMFKESLPFTLEATKVKTKKYF